MQFSIHSKVVANPVHIFKLGKPVPYSSRVSFFSAHTYTSARTLFMLLADLTCTWRSNAEWDHGRVDNLQRKIVQWQQLWLWTRLQIQAKEKPNFLEDRWTNLRTTVGGLCKGVNHIGGCWGCWGPRSGFFLGGPRRRRPLEGSQQTGPQCRPRFRCCCWVCCDVRIASRSGGASCAR